MDIAATVKWLTHVVVGIALCGMAARAQPNSAPESRMRLLARRFQDYTILLAAPPEEPWRASWNDQGQMALFENTTNGVVISSQYLKFPPDVALDEAAGDRDKYLDIG